MGAGHCPSLDEGLGIVRIFQERGKVGPGIVQDPLTARPQADSCGFRGRTWGYAGENRGNCSGRLVDSPGQARRNAWIAISCGAKRTRPPQVVERPAKRVDWGAELGYSSGRIASVNAPSGLESRTAISLHGPSASPAASGPCFSLRYLRGIQRRNGVGVSCVSGFSRPRTAVRGSSSTHAWGARRRDRGDRDLLAIPLGGMEGCARRAWNLGGSQEHGARGE